MPAVPATFAEAVGTREHPTELAATRCDGVRDHNSIAPIHPCRGCFHLWLANAVPPSGRVQVPWMEPAAVVRCNGVAWRVECANFREA